MWRGSENMTYEGRAEGTHFVQSRIEKTEGVHDNSLSIWKRQLDTEMMNSSLWPQREGWKINLQWRFQSDTRKEERSDQFLRRSEWVVDQSSMLLGKTMQVFKDRIDIHASPAVVSGVASLEKFTHPCCIKDMLYLNLLMGKSKQAETSCHQPSRENLLIHLDAVYPKVTKALGK